jgi:hypothetical protein
MLAGVLPYILLRVVLTERATVSLPLLPDQERRWRNRGWIGWWIFGCGLAAIALAIACVASGGKDFGSIAAALGMPRATYLVQRGASRLFGDIAAVAAGLV